LYHCGVEQHFSISVTSFNMTASLSGEIKLK
jgi:hypothetical protein